MPSQGILNATTTTTIAVTSPAVRAGWGDAAMIPPSAAPRTIPPGSIHLHIPGSSSSPGVRDDSALPPRTTVPEQRPQPYRPHGQKGGGKIGPGDRAPVTPSPLAQPP